MRGLVNLRYPLGPVEAVRVQAADSESGAGAYGRVLRIGTFPFTPGDIQAILETPYVFAG